MKKKNKNNLMVAIVAIILVTFTACGNTGKKDQARQSSEQDQGLTKAEIMQQYFPLKIGNKMSLHSGRTDKHGQNHKQKRTAQDRPQGRSTKSAARMHQTP